MWNVSFSTHDKMQLRDGDGFVYIHEDSFYQEIEIRTGKVEFHWQEYDDDDEPTGVCCCYDPDKELLAQLGDTRRLDYGGYAKLEWICGRTGHPMEAFDGLRMARSKSFFLQLGYEIED